MDNKKVFMNFTVAPSPSDIETLTKSIVEALPEEFDEYIEDINVNIEELADDVTQNDQDVDDAYDLITIYKSGNEISPGIEKTDAKENDVLIIYRRPVLDMWCETGEDLTDILRQAIIEEIGQYFEFSDDEIDTMIEQHHQGML